ncbi:MFS transporter [Sinomonas atrocyanea]|uniref:MFS transporter n=2 Tax=Sinomonas atrocyanea TaxID=37927 RepID=A0A126ZYX2_9MICC|nr:MFS transporter [Sinomonas atrocyanea]GEB63915.1 MFS transporter [Sinomonas atrocyanea]GGG66916.1 MFS transporter [Sinomonas atrocyanea]
MPTPESSMPLKAPAAAAAGGPSAGAPAGSGTARGHRSTLLAPKPLFWAMLALGLGGFAIGTVEFATMGLLKEIERGLAISTPQAGQLISAYALGVVVGAPLLAAIGARLPRKALVLGLMAFYAVANLSSFVAADYGAMLVSRFAAGLPHGAYFGTAAVIAASLVAPTKRGWAIATVMSGLTIANVLGVPAATWLGQSLGWRLLFVVTAAIALACVAMVARFVPYEPPHPEASIRRELSALRRGQLWLALAVGVVGFGGFFATYTYIAHTMTSIAGLPEALMPVVVALYGLGMVVGNMAGGRLADRSVMGTIYWALAAVAGVMVLYGLAAPVWPLALLMVFVVGGSGSILIPALQARLLDSAPGAATLATSLSHSALNVANALGAFLGGVVIAAGWGFVAPAYVGAGLAVLGLGIALLSGALERRRAR